MTILVTAKKLGDSVRVNYDQVSMYGRNPLAADGFTREPGATLLMLSGHELKVAETVEEIDALVGETEIAELTKEILNLVRNPEVPSEPT